MGRPVVHFEVVGNDAAGLQQYYGDLFDWSVDTNNPMNYGIVTKEDAGIGGGVGQSPDGSGHVTFYVHVDDINACLETAEGLGGKTVMPRTEHEMVTLALVADPEGNVVGLVE
jgi:predicted enzyme related to lactoylglutathione lyase